VCVASGCTHFFSFWGKKKMKKKVFLVKKILAILLSLAFALQINVLAIDSYQTTEMYGIKDFEVVSVIKYEDYYGISYRFNEESKEYEVSGYQYYGTDAGGFPCIEYILYLTDGTTKTGKTDSYGCFYFDYMNHSFEIEYEAGEHRAGSIINASISLYDKTVTVPIEILESPVESIELTPKKIIEGTVDRELVNGYDEESGKYKDYLQYRLSEVISSIKVNFKDGTSKYCSIYGLDYNGYEFDIWGLDNQSYNNQWSVGNTYYIGVNVGGATATTTVEIIETPVERIEFEEIKIIEKTEGYQSIDYDEETGEEKEYFEYRLSDPNFKVYLKDGTVLESYYDKSIYPFYKGVNFEGKRYRLDTEYNYGQSYDNQWQLGKNTVKASVLGFETEYTVEIIENPIEKIIIDEVYLKENVDGHYDSVYDYDTGEETITDDFYYDYTPQLTVYFKDGTMQKSDGNYLDYDGESYWIYFDDGQYDSLWGIGQHRGTAEVLGIEAEYTVNIEENDYKALSINNNGDGIELTFTKNSGEKITMNVEKFEANRGDQGVVGGVLTTDKGVFDNVSFYFYAPDNEAFDYSKNVYLEIGSLKSNVLDSCEWLKAHVRTISWSYAVKCYKNYYRNKFFGNGFEAYTGIVTEENIDDIIIIAINAFLYTDYNYENYEICEKDGFFYGIFDCDYVKKAVKEVFGIENIDLTKSSFYNSQTPEKLMVLGIEELAYDYGMRLKECDYSNGEYNFTYNPNEIHTEIDYNLLKVVFDKNAVIKEIEFIKNKEYGYGDINKDGEVTAEDLKTFVKSLLQNEVNNNDKDVFDANKDGVVNILDFIRLKKYEVGNI